jgi:hydroxypyruvate isomerase
MPKFSTSLSMMFNEVDFLDRFAAAARAGFRGVEYMFPYDYDKHRLRETLDANGLTQVLHNLPAGDWNAGERGIACLPGRTAEFQTGVARAIEYATALGCTRLNCLAGIAPAGLDPNEARQTFVSNLKYAAPRLRDSGIQLTIESVNTRDIPGFFLNRTSQAVDVLEAVGSDNLFLLYDVYHMQIADVPARHEPGTGTINFPEVFNLVDRNGYSGWIGCEYKPGSTTEAGLGWAKNYL